MKKSTMENLVNCLNELIGINGGEEYTKAELVTARDELVTELSKGAEKAQANRDLYASAHDVVINALDSANAPVTMSELWTAVEKNVPDGMTKGKMQYAVTRLWTDEIVKTEGKVNTYSLKA